MKADMKILVFIISLFFIPLVYAQEGEEVETEEAGTEEEEIKEKWTGPEGIFLGYDVSNFLVHALNTSITEFEVSADLVVTKDLFICGELGVANYDFSGSDYLYDATSDGFLWRAGFGYNFLEKRQKNDVITVGLLYGNSVFNLSASGLVIEDSRYGSVTLNDMTFKGQTANWLELAFALKVELFANIFLGWSARGKVYLTGTDYDLLKPHMVPGYGNYSRNVNATLTYSVFYRIPFKKSQPPPEEEIEDTE